MLCVDCEEHGVLTVRHIGDVAVSEGDAVGLSFREGHLQFFGEAGRRIAG